MEIIYNQQTNYQLVKHKDPCLNYYKINSLTSTKILCNDTIVIKFESQKVNFKYVLLQFGMCLILTMFK